uniref:SHSP domain-containing protein n=1 Tax=Oryzias latipes TaxID=8090 RepID=A0A3B3HGC9_ORYLA
MFLHSDLSPSMFFFSPVRSLWPEVRLCSTSGSFAEELQELRSSLELMDKFQDKNLEETSLSRAVDPATMSFQSCLSEETGRKGSYSYRLRSSDKTVTCCLSPDGKLHIQAKEEADRELTIRGARRRTKQERIHRNKIANWDRVTAETKIHRREKTIQPAFICQQKLKT